jgi:hypothetical protein
MGATLFLAFSIAALPALVAAGFLLEWQAREALEAELTRRVESLAVGASAWIHPSTWPLILELKAGDEESRTARYVRSSLERIRSEGEVERIALWTADGRLIVDTSLALPIGVAAPRATLLRRELEIVRSGRTASTPLFRTSSGKLMKIGLAPVPGERGGDAPTGVAPAHGPRHTAGGRRQADRPGRPRVPRARFGRGPDRSSRRRVGPYAGCGSRP